MGDRMEFDVDEIEQIIAWIKNFERKDIPENVWYIILKWQDKLDEFFYEW